MVKNETVLFQGCGWPVVVAARAPGSLRSRVTFTAAAKGREWSTDRPLGFWRNFSAIEVPDPKVHGSVGNPDIEQPFELFVARHGDPTGQLDRCAAAGQRIISNTFCWGPLVAALSQVAAAWDTPDDLGVSAITIDRDRLAAADEALRRLLPTDRDGNREIAREIEVQYTAHGITLAPQTLRAFMVISAASARERGIDMRRCAFCSDWLEFRRNDAVHCSPSCQASHHRRRAAVPGANSNTGRDFN
jgi:hypothetical protein